MSLEPQPETPRTGKYCPRCRAMAPRDQNVCRQCGHQFRTGTDNPVPEQTSAPDPLNRTMQFVLPPLRPHPAPVAPALLPVRLAAPRPATLRLALAAGIAALLLCFGAFFLWRQERRPASPNTPVGVWETSLHGRASANARLEFAFQPGGTGRFSWRESGPAALSGQTPLRWQVNADQTLSLALTPPAGSDAVSQTLASLWSSHPWPWRRDTRPPRLLLGTLVLSEKP